jgi:hypothetical protein
MLPNFLVIGAAKSGTSSLWMYLREHPEIFMPQRKEVNFLCEPGWRDRLDWYEQHFEGATERVRGEASVYYSMHPFKPDVAAHAFEIAPEAKLIYLVRDPVPRAVAHYVQNVAVGYETRAIDAAFADYEAADNEYVCSSRYASQLREYLRFFPRERIHVADQRDLLTNREQVLRDMFRFLEVDDAFRSERFEELANVREQLMRPTALSWRLRTTAAAGLVRRLPPGLKRPIGQAARRIFDQPVEQRPTLDPVLAAAIEEHLRPEVAELSALTGLGFGSWSISGRPPAEAQA